MIRNYNNDDLAQKRVAEKYYLFCQVWKELTEAKTLDSYQFRIMNVLAALREVGMVIEQRLNHFTNTDHNIEECKKEAVSIIKRDSILQKVYPNVRGRLLAHLADRTETDAQKKALHYQVKYCYNILQKDYLDKLVEGLEKDIENQNEQGIIQKTNQLVSNCVSYGWSVTALHHLVDILNQSENQSERWDTFKRKVLKKEIDQYQIVIPLKIRVHAAVGQKNESVEKKIHDAISESYARVVVGEDLVKEYPDIDSVAQEQTYLIIEVSACDYYSASHEALGKYSNVLNLLSFYNLIDAWNIRDVSWYAINVLTKEYKHLKSKDVYSTYDYVEGASHGFKIAKQIDRYLGNSLQKKLQAVYSYANIGKSSYSQTEKFINTWVALESLCRTEVYDNIISNVLETVPAALCLRYMYRLFRNFAEDCVRCKVDLTFSNMSVNAKHPQKEKVVSDILVVLRDEDAYGELLERCKVNNLLKQRCEEMHILATDNEQMFDRIENHYLNVRRQLGRLYRLRNEIVHSALNADVALLQYVEHLDDYLGVCVSEVVKCYEMYNETEIEAIFEIIKDNYRQFSEIKNDKKQCKELLLKDLCNTGVIALV